MGAKAKIDDYLHLPICDEINIEAIKEDLTLHYGRKKMRLWSLDKKNNCLILPKYYISPSSYEDYAIEFEKVKSKYSTSIDITDKITLRENQEKAWANLKDSEGGFLILGTGKGKSVLALKKIAHEKKRAKIIVHNTYLFEQWRRFIKEFLVLNGKEIEDEDIGEIKSGVFNYKNEICLVMMQSLVNKLKSGDIPKDFSNSADIWIFDEGHHVPAMEFMKVLPLCRGQIYILTATEKRPDGRESALKWFVGDIIYKDISTNLTPEIFFVECELPNKYEGHTEKVISDIGGDKLFSDFRLSFIKENIEGRKSLCISSRRNQLHYLNEKIESTLIVSDVDKKIREDLIKQADTTFIIDQLGSEGLDVPELDTLFVLLPISSDQRATSSGTTEYLGNNFRQILGRICRTSTNKKPPICYIFDDVNVEPLHKMCNKLKIFMDINKMKYEVIKWQ